MCCMYVACEARVAGLCVTKRSIAGVGTAGCIHVYIIYVCMIITKSPSCGTRAFGGSTGSLCIIVY